MSKETEKTTRFYAYRYPEFGGVTSIEFYSDDHVQLANNHTPALLMPLKIEAETNRIYVDVENEEYKECEE